MSDSSEKRDRKKWIFEDLIDFEAYRLLDEGKSTEELEIRDRQIFTRLKEPGASNRDLLWHWRRARAKAEPLIPQPGSTLSAILWTVGIYTMVVSLLGGAGLAYGTMAYDGTVPINVSVFLGLVIAPQMLLLLGMIPLLLGLFWKPQWISRFYSIPSNLIRIGCQRLWRSYMLHSDRDKNQQQLDELKISLRQFQTIINRNRSVFANRIFSMFQLAGIAFNCGVLAVAGVLLLFTDRAFGWQSSIVESEAQVSDLVRWIALPWKNWLFVGSNYPSLEAIEASKTVLSHDMGTVDASNLLAWWPFLILAVVFYGLLPRLIVWVISHFNQRRLLAQVSVETGSSIRLLDRMRSVSLQVAGDQSSASRAIDDERVDVTNSNESEAKASHACCLVLEDALTRYSEGVIEAYLNQTLRCESIRIEGTASLDLELQVSEMDESIVLLLEGWQPPINEMLRAIEGLANQCAEQSVILKMLLIGRPSKIGHRELTDAEFKIWENKVKLLDCSHLILLKPSN